MSYALRNSLILTGLLVLVVLGFFIGNSSSVKKLNTIKTSYENNKKQLNELQAANPDMKDQDLFLKSLKEMEEQVQTKSKIIPRQNDPTLTYKYLLDICDNFCPDVKFDFLYTQSGRIENTNYNVYTLFGKAPIRSLYTFVRQIEGQFQLYVIDSFKILENIEDGLSTGEVSFTILLNAYYEENAPELDEMMFRKLKYKQIAYNPFYSRIHGRIPDEEEQRFLDPYSVILIGLTPDKVFLKDSNGRIHILEEGNKVAYGYLESIEWETQSVVFKLNEIGVIKEKVIYLHDVDEE
jgi:hypothetical protein